MTIKRTVCDKIERSYRLFKAKDALFRVTWLLSTGVNLNCHVITWPAFRISAFPELFKCHLHTFLHKRHFPGHVTIIDKLQLNFTVLPAVNWICHYYVTCILQFQPLQLSKFDLTNFQRLNYILRVTWLMLKWNKRTLAKLTTGQTMLSRLRDRYRTVGIFHPMQLNIKGRGINRTLKIETVKGQTVGGWGVIAYTWKNLNNFGFKIFIAPVFSC